MNVTESILYLKEHIIGATYQKSPLRIAFISILEAVTTDGLDRVEKSEALAAIEELKSET